MWDLIVEKQMPPTRLTRYCCAVFKESSTLHRYIATGVRASESNSRKGRDIFNIVTPKKGDGRHYSIEHVREVYNESLYTGKSQGLGANDYDVYDCQFIKAAKENRNLVCSPIYEWSDNDIWEYIDSRGIKLCDLYRMGYARVGCVGCPMGSYRCRKKEFNDFPTIKRLYIRAFENMLIARERAGKPYRSWHSGEEVFNWWMEEYKHNVRGQIGFEEYMEGKSNAD